MLWFENIVGKEENDGDQHCLIFPKCFQKALPPGSLSVGIVNLSLDLNISNKSENATLLLLVKMAEKCFFYFSFFFVK